MKILPLARRSCVLGGQRRSLASRERMSHDTIMLRRIAVLVTLATDRYSTQADVCR
jgi:hypothetical protein